MAKPSTKSRRQITIEYENLDLPPAYVESAQGMPSQGGVLHVSFFSDRVAALEKISGPLQLHEDGKTKTLGANLGDSFGMDKGDVRVIRRVEEQQLQTIKQQSEALSNDGSGQ